MVMWPGPLGAERESALGFFEWQSQFGWSLFKAVGIEQQQVFNGCKETCMIEQRNKTYGLDFDVACIRVTRVYVTQARTAMLQEAKSRITLLQLNLPCGAILQVLDHAEQASTELRVWPVRWAVEPVRPRRQQWVGLRQRGCRS